MNMDKIKKNKIRSRNARKKSKAKQRSLPVLKYNLRKKLTEEEPKDPPPK